MKLKFWKRKKTEGRPRSIRLGLPIDIRREIEEDVSRAVSKQLDSARSLYALQEAYDRLKKQLKIVEGRHPAAAQLVAELEDLKARVLQAETIVIDLRTRNEDLELRDHERRDELTGLRQREKHLKSIVDARAEPTDELRKTIRSLKTKLKRRDAKIERMKHGTHRTGNPKKNR